MAPTTRKSAVRALCLIFALAFAHKARTDCSAQVLDVKVIDPPTQVRARVDVQYNVTGGGRLNIYINDVNWDGPLVSGSGTYSQYEGPLLACLTPGTYTYRAEIIADCGATGSTAVARYYDPTPTVNATLLGIDANSASLVFSVDYTFPYISEGSGPHARDLYVRGRVGQSRVLQPGDPWQGTVQLSAGGVKCLGTGTYPYWVEGVTSCRVGSSEPGTFSIKQATITGVSVQQLDDSGRMRATVGYAFEATLYNDERRVDVYYNGAQIGGENVPASGTVTYDFAAGCLPPATTGVVKGVAVACGRQADPAFRDEKETTFAVPFEQGSISNFAALLNPPVVTLSGTVQLPTGVTNATVVITRLAYIGDSGIFHDAAVLPGIGVTATNPDFSAADTPPELAPGIQYEARLTYCNGEDDDGAGAGATSCPISSDDPPNATPLPVAYVNGDMRYTDTDPLPRLLDGIALQRTYDSYNHARGSFGRGWTSLFDSRLFVKADGVGATISFTTDTEPVMFRRRNGMYKQLGPTGRNAGDVLAYESSNALYVYRRAGATTALLYRDSDGRFVGYRQLGTGREARITYDVNGLPQSVTDNWANTTWSLNVDAAKKRVTSITIGSLTWQYQYDASDHLTGVLAPGAATWRTYAYTGDLLTEVHDGAGNLIEAHTFDASGRAITETSQAGDITNIEYNATGSSETKKITNVTMRTGAVTQWTLQPTGGAWRTVRINGTCSSCGARDSVYAYDGSGHLLREQNASGYITVRTYGNDRLASVQRSLRPADCDPATSQTHCMLEPSTLATTALTTTSASITATYDYDNPLFPDEPTTISTPSVGEGSRRETFAYHPLNGEVAVHGISGVTPSGQQPRTTVSFYGDTLPGGTAEDRDPVTINPYAPAFDPGGVFQSTWLLLAQPPLRRSVDGPRSDVADVTFYVYYPVDASVPATLRGRLAAVRNAAGHITRHESYDLFGNPTRIVDPNGVATEMTYDSLGRLLTTTIKAVAGCDTSRDVLCNTDLTSSRTYRQTTGSLETDQRPGGGVTKYEYDGLGRVTTISRGPTVNDLREQIVTTYDPATGHKSAEIFNAKENGAWIEKKRESYAYDSLGQLQTITHPGGSTIAYTYDSQGRIESVRDENHATANTTYTYDPAGRLGTVRQTLSTATGGNITTQYGYDAQGNLTTVTDPNGNATQYTYDDFGRMVTQTSPVTGTTAYEYDAAGNLTRSVDANQMATVRVYDALNRIISSTSRKVAGPQPIPPSRGETPPPPPALPPPPEIVQWIYDEPLSDAFRIGRLSTTTDPAGTTLYSYDRRGFVRKETRIIGAASYITRYQQDADSNRAMITYPSGRTASYTFDFAGRPLTASTTSGTTTTNLVSSATYLPFGPAVGVVYGNATTRTRTFDSRYRMMTNAFTGPNAQLIASYQYAYDNAGNITQLHDLMSPAYNRDFGYDDLNRLVTSNSGTSLWGNGSYTYDRMGNMLSATTTLNSFRTFSYIGTTPNLSSVLEGSSSRQVTYDASGNEVTVGTSSFTYSPRNSLASRDGVGYGYDGRGVRTTTTVGSARTFTFYLPELRLLAETASSTAATPPIAYEYLWFGEEPLAQVDTTTNAIRWYFNDHLAQPLLLTTTSASVLWRAEYEPYGAVFAFRAGASERQPLRLPGQEKEQNSDVAYNIFRWYRAGWGRYTQADPIVRMAALAPYEYAGDAPTVATDPLGLLTTIPGPPPPNMGTVYCDGNGGIALQIDPRFSSQQYDCYAATCLVIHEQRHASDFMMASGGRICQGQPRGTWIIYSSQREEDIYELRGNQAELDCLASERCRASQQCRTLIDDRTRQLNADQTNRRRRLGYR
jgi:RHS repeat-associated protein